jgi:hypothetical protein
MGFWGENWRVHERKPKNRAAYSGAARMASSWRAQGELPSSAPMFLVDPGTRGQSRLFQIDSFDVFDCTIAF